MDIEYLLVDKLFNITRRIIAKYARDFYDIYELANFKSYKLNEIEDAWVSSNKYFNADKPIYAFNPGNFKELEQEVKAVLDKERLSVSFSDLYSRVCRFACPIFEYLIYKKENRYWDVKRWLWLGMD